MNFKLLSLTFIVLLTSRIILLHCMEAPPAKIVQPHIQESHTEGLITFDEFAANIANKPTYRTIAQRPTTVEKRKGTFVNPALYKIVRCITLEQFELIIDKFFIVMQNQLSSRHTWLNQDTEIPFAELASPTSTILGTTAQKLVLRRGSQFICKGDLHGAVHALVACLKHLVTKGYLDQQNPLKIKDKRTHLIFLGDYVDRGAWGVETIALLMLLKIHNPDNVTLVRGNHEDPGMTESYGFTKEFYSKFVDYHPDACRRVYKKIERFYNYLPLVLYVGSGTSEKKYFVQCCHGGLEIGYNPKELLNAPGHTYQYIPVFNRAENAKELPQVMVRAGYGVDVPIYRVVSDFKPITTKDPTYIGLLWHYFLTDPRAQNSAALGNHEFRFNKETTRLILEAASTPENELSAVIRAHQHNPDNEDTLMQMMLQNKGCAWLWKEPHEQLIQFTKGTVVTLLLSPDSLYSLPYYEKQHADFDGFEFDTTLIVEIPENAERIEDWKPIVINNSLYEQKNRTIF